MKIKLLVITSAAAFGLVAAGLGGTAIASVASSAPKQITVCANRANQVVRIFDKATSCARPNHKIAWNAVGPQGARGPAGPSGAPGQSGVVATASINMLAGGNVPSVPTGGSFSANKTIIGTVHLAAGTYLVNVNFEATPNSVSTGQVFPQVFVYNGPQANGSFENDLFNVGAGALEQATASEIAQDPINSYYSGSSEITVPAGGETLDLYAFGYDSDQGASTYALNALTVTDTQLQVAGS